MLMVRSGLGPVLIGPHSQAVLGPICGLGPIGHIGPRSYRSVLQIGPIKKILFFLFFIYSFSGTEPGLRQNKVSFFFIFLFSRTFFLSQLTVQRKCLRSTWSLSSKKPGHSLKFFYFVLFIFPSFLFPRFSTELWERPRLK